MIGNLDIEQVKSLLGEELLAKPGEFLYSAVHSLKPGELYILGTNPGEVRAPSRYPTVGEQLHHLPNKDFNHYEKTGWALENSERVHCKISPLGKKLEWIIQKLNRGYTLADVCASNLIFMRTRTLNEIPQPDFNFYAAQCWKAHRLIIDIVQPKALLVFGNSGHRSAYAFLKNELPLQCQGSFASGHGRTSVRWFKTQLDGRQMTVFGLPHLSRFSLKEDAVFTISKMLESDAHIEGVESLV